MPTISQDEARDALLDIEQVARHTRHMLAGSQLGANLTLWGAIWMVAFTLCYVWPEDGARIWSALSVPGLAATFYMGWRHHRRAAVLSARSRSLMAQTMLFWVAVMAYAMGLGMLLPLRHGTDQLVVILVVLMLGYVTMGIWVRSALISVIGLLVTAATVAGRVSVGPRAFMLWMAVFGGGALLAPGLYIKLKWK